MLHMKMSKSLYNYVHNNGFSLTEKRKYGMVIMKKYPDEAGKDGAGDDKKDNNGMVALRYFAYFLREESCLDSL